MKNMTKDKYLRDVLKHVANDAMRGEIRAELENHIAERTEYYTDCGYDEKAAEEKAIEKMGSPDDAGAQFERLSGEYYLAKANFVITFVAYLAAVIFFIVMFYDLNGSAFKYGAPTMVSFGTLLGAMAAFLEGAMLLHLIYKHRLRTGALVFGITSILAGLLCPSLFMTFGYGIIGFFTDFPAEFLYKPAPQISPLWGYFVDRYEFLGKKMLPPNEHFVFGDGLRLLTDNETLISAVGVITTIFMLIFAASAFISGIAAIVMHVRMKKENFTEKDNKHLKRLIILTSVVAIFGTAICAVELCTPTIKNRINYCKSEQAFEKDAEDMTALVLAIEEDSSYENLTAQLDKYGYLYEWSKTEVKKDEYRDILRIYANNNFTLGVNIEDNRVTGVGVSARDFASASKEEIENFDLEASSNEILKNLTFKKIIRYEATLKDGEYPSYERFDIQIIYNYNNVDYAYFDYNGGEFTEYNSYNGSGIKPKNYIEKEN